MSLFGETGRFDGDGWVSDCKHGKSAGFNCAACAMGQAERDARAPERKPYGTEFERIKPLTPWEKDCAEFDAREDEKAGISPVLVGGRK